MSARFAGALRTTAGVSLLLAIGACCSKTPHQHDLPNQVGGQHCNARIDELCGAGSALCSSEQERQRCAEDEKGRSAVLEQCFREVYPSFVKSVPSCEAMRLGENALQTLWPGPDGKLARCPMTQ